MNSVHGNELINRFVSNDEIEHYEREAQRLPRLVIEERYVSDCEMIANGGFSPLKGFMGSKEVQSVLDSMRLTNGLLWSIPVLLPIPKERSKELGSASKVALYDKHSRLIAVIQISECFSLDLAEYCTKVYGTSDPKHPGVAVIFEHGNHFIAGEITAINKPVRGTIQESYYLDPKHTREEFARRGWRTVVAFQTRNPIHRAHEYLLKCAHEAHDGLLIHPLVGATKKDDVPADVRMKCYEVILSGYFNKEKTMLSVLPAAMRYAGPREAIHHFLLRKNYGCTHMIVGRDHAGVGDYYGTYEAQELVKKFATELGIQPIPFEHAFYCKSCSTVATNKTCPHSSGERIHLSGTKVRAMVREGKKPPQEFSRPEVANLLVEWGLNTNTLHKKR